MLREVLVFIPTVLVSTAVVRQSKWVAALAQMGALQVRPLGSSTVACAFVFVCVCGAF